MRTPSPVALDHNFPEPLLRSISRWLPEVEFHWIKDLDGRLNELEDHELIYELYRRGFPVMVTNNHKMLDDPRVLVAIEQTRVTVAAIERAGDDPIFATGVLLRDLRDVIERNVGKGQYYRLRPSRVSPRRPADHAATLGLEWEAAVRDLSRSFRTRSPYPEGDPRRVR